MIVKLLTEHHLKFLSLKVGCRGSSDSTHVKMSLCWKSHALAHMTFHFRMKSLLLSLLLFKTYSTFNLRHLRTFSQVLATVLKIF